MPGAAGRRGEWQGITAGIPRTDLWESLTERTDSAAQWFGSQFRRRRSPRGVIFSQLFNGLRVPERSCSQPALFRTV